MAASHLRSSFVWAVALALLGGPGHATSFLVDDTADVGDASRGDGTCATRAGTCTLRAAVQEANALTGPDTITLPAGVYRLTTPGIGEQAAGTGDLDVS